MLAHGHPTKKEHDETDLVLFAWRIAREWFAHCPDSEFIRQERADLMIVIYRIALQSKAKVRLKKPYGASKYEPSGRKR